MNTAKTKSHSYHKGHVAFFYASLPERAKLLADYFREGFEHNELCVLATPGTSTQAVADLLLAGLDAEQAVTDGDLRVFEMYQTYMPDGRFVSDYMLANVSNFIEDSQKLGYSGLRTAGEMRWINVHPDFLPDASHYESNVNHIGHKHRDFVGLCMYPLVEDAGPILKDALLTHPAFIYDGKLHLNPYATEAENNKVTMSGDLPAFREFLATI